MPQPKKILVLETVQEESSESFDEDSLDLEDMTLLAMKFRNFLKFSKIENKKKPLDLVSNPRVNTVRVHEIGNNLREKKERKKRLGYQCLYGKKDTGTLTSRCVLFLSINTYIYDDLTMSICSGF